LSFPDEWESDPNAEIFSDAPSEKNGFKLYAASMEDLRDSMLINLAVSREGGLGPDEIVTFLLHPSYKEPMNRVKAVDGVAPLKIWADGWFTVVAIVESDFTTLSLSLKTLANVPDWFKEN
jgi:hypothetical protein